MPGHHLKVLIAAWLTKRSQTKFKDGENAEESAEAFVTDDERRPHVKPTLPDNWLIRCISSCDGRAHEGCHDDGFISSNSVHT